MLLGELCIVQAELLIDPNPFSSLLVLVNARIPTTPASYSPTPCTIQIDFVR